MKVAKNNIDRVVFFSKEDLSWANMLNKAEKILNNLQNLSNSGINDLLELYQIKLYFDNNIFLTKWTADERATYTAIITRVFDEIRDAFVNLDVKTLNELIQSIEFSYRRSFWYLISLFETYKRIDRDSFLVLLNNSPNHIRNVLTNKQLVLYFNNEIRTFLLGHSESAEILLSHFEEKHSRRQCEYFFPKSLSSTDIHSIIRNYLALENPNLNYVDLIQNSKHLKLPPKLLLKAKQLSESIKDEYLTEENSFKISVEATLDMVQKEPVIYNHNQSETKACYGGAFFDTMEDDVQLFAVFSDVFLYTNEEGLIDLFSKDVELDTLEKILMRSKNEYHTGQVFCKKDMLSFIQLEIFSAYLKKKGRNIEEFIDNFVQQFFRERAKLNNVVFEMPDANLGPSDKIRLLAPELEYLLKQYKSLVNEEGIDHDLLQIDSSPIFYSEIPSLVKQKYVMPVHKTILSLQYQFFNPDSILSDRQKQNRPSNLFQKITTEKIIKSDLEDYQQDYISFLEKQEMVRLDENGVIGLVDPIQIFISGRLRKNEALSYWRYPNRVRTKVDEMVENKLLNYSSSLFTSEEVSYINYYLNKKEFANGHDLRNKYLHGSNKRKLNDQQTDYRYFLRIVVLILLKLKDDIEIYEALSDY